jgi:hypothetical protein
MSFCQAEKKATAVLVSCTNEVRELQHFSQNVPNFANGTHGA